MRKQLEARRATALLLATMLALPTVATAQEQPDGWNWRATVYAWLPTIEGTTQFPSGEEGSIEIGVDDLLDNLDFTFMGALQVDRGRWGFFTDVLYLDEGIRNSAYREVSIGPGELPGNVSLDVNMDVKSWVWTLGGTYSLLASPHNRVDLLIGARMVDMDQELDWTLNGSIGELPLPGRSGSAAVAETLWDAIVGLKGHARFGAEGRWVVPYHLDVGAGDSDLTWQAMAGLGYQFSWGAVVFNYRYLDYDPGSGSPITDLNFSGPMIGASFTW